MSRQARQRILPPGLAGVGGAMAVLALAVYADQTYFAHGLAATWRTEYTPDANGSDGRGGKAGDHKGGDGEGGDDETHPAKAGDDKTGSHAQTHVVDRTVEHRVSFPNEHRPLSRYVQAWPFAELGVPDKVPRLHATLEGWLRVPPGPPRVVSAQSPNTVHLEIDGGDADNQPPLPPGRHYLHVRWEGTLKNEAGLRFLWAERGEAARLLPRTALTPPGNEWPPSRRALWIIAPLLALLFGVGLGRVTSARTETTRRHRLAVLGAALILVLGLGWRLWDYPVMPEFSENPDELFATWNGWQLLENGTTRGWSLWPRAYGDRVEHTPFSYFKKGPLHVIQPYFEHPPLMHLTVGAVAHAGGADHWSHARLKHTRLVPIGLGMVSLVLVMAIARRVFPWSGAWGVAGLVYAVTPSIALQERVIKEESLMVPLALASVWAFLRWRDEGQKRRHLVGAAVGAGAAALAKAPGAVYVLVLVLLVASQRRWRPAFGAGLLGAAIASLFLLYGAILDWDVFWFTQVKQATGRPAHWNLFPRFFADPGINHNLVGFGWHAFLWMGYIATVAGCRRRDADVLILPPIVYLIALGISSGNWTFGWYFLTLYPFLCIGAGQFIVEMWRRPGLLRGFLFVGLFVAYGMNFMFDLDWMKNNRHWGDIRTMVTVFFVALLVPYALAHVVRTASTRWLARAATVVGMVLFVAGTGNFVVHYDRLYEEYRNFDRMEYFNR